MTRKGLSLIVGFVPANSQNTMDLEKMKYVKQETGACKKKKEKLKIFQANI